MGGTTGAAGTVGTLNIGDTIAEFREEVLTAAINNHIPPQSMPEQWDVAGLESTLQSDFGLKLPIQQWLDEDDKLYEETLRERILAELLAAYNEKETQASAEALRTFEKQILLRVLDDLWKDHLSTMDHLRHGIHLRGYAQKNPKQEYKREAFELFGLMQQRIRNDVTRVLMTVRIQSPEEVEKVEEAAPSYANVQYTHADFAQAAAAAEGADPESIALAVQHGPETEPAGQQPVRRFGDKIGRNDPCPCGSGKKYKQCHGRLA